MSQKFIAIAYQLFATPTFQNGLRNSSYKPSRTMQCAIAGARNFLEVCDAKGFEGNPTVALAHYANRLGDYLFDYGDRQMKELASAAIDLAIEFDRTLLLEIGEVPKQSFAKEPESPSGELFQDVPLEKCGLPGPVLESLMAAGHSTGQGVIDADSQGKIVGLPGIQVATRDKTVAKIKEAMKAAATAPKDEQPKSDDAPKTEGASTAS